MKNMLGKNSLLRAASLSAVLMVLIGPATQLAAQNNAAEARIRSMEAQIRALQRKVFPGEGRVFGPEIVTPAPAASGAETPVASNPVGDLSTRLDSVEAQLRRLTGMAEENGNKLAQLEARLNGAATATTAATATPAATPAATPTPTATPSPTPTPTPAAPDSNLAAMTGGASAPRPAATPTPTPTPRPSPAARGPSAQRLAAVRAIAKPQTQDPGDDEYSYGYRLWVAKFYPEAQQQLKLMIERYPRHSKVSYARNLLGRAYLDDAKPRDAATWFLQNYNTNKTGERAPDSLLYLAESMRQLRDTNRSCIALGEFASSYPREAAGRLKTQYDATRGGVKCN